MILQKRHNDLFVKKVSDIKNLFKWNNVLDEDFPQLPINCVTVKDTLVSQPIGFQDEAYQHHATLGGKFGNIYLSHTIHPYDEDAGGMKTSLKKSSDNGITWVNLGDAFPQMSDVVDNGVSPAQWNYPSLFMDLPSGFYLLMVCVSSFPSYDPVGVAVRKINQDNTFDDILWVKNPLSESDRTPPVPLSGYPSYNFASEELIDQVKYYINRLDVKPKLLFGWDEVNVTRDVFDNTDQLREPFTIQPYNYQDALKVWRATLRDFNIVAAWSDLNNLIISELPNRRETTVKRFYNYSSEIIIGVGHSAKPNREELVLFIARKNNNTGQYVIADNDAYSLTHINQKSPAFTGAFKNGGEQLVDINRVSKNKLNLAFSVSKESIYFKQIDISVLI